MVVKTEVQGIEASDILNEFECLKKMIKSLVNSGTHHTKNDLLTRKQVCDYLDISLGTLHNWSRNGMIKSYKIGNKVRYKKNEIIDALRVVNTKMSK